MTYLLVSLLCITFYAQSMHRDIREKDEYLEGKEDKDFISEGNQKFNTLFSHLFPGRDEEELTAPQTIPLPLKKIMIEKDMVPLLKQSRTVLPSYIQKKIQFITSSLAEKKNLEVVTPLMLIFGKSGRGKSTLALSIAQVMQEKAKWTIYRVGSTDIANQFQNSGPQNIKEIAKKLFEEETGSILIIEDMNGFYPQHQSGDTNDSGENAIAFWQLLDQIQNNPQKKVLLIATESTTDMPPQIKERLGHTMIVLKSLTTTHIKAYLKFMLKQQSSVHTECHHAQKKRKKTKLTHDVIKTKSCQLAANCKKCRSSTQEECIQELSTVRALSYTMLQRIHQQAVRASVNFAFNHDTPHTFILSELASLAKKHRKTSEYKILKMDKEYKSEQEKLHKKQTNQKKEMHVKQQGLTLKQLHQGYKQTKQQLLFNALTDKGGLPNYGQEDPEKLLTTKQYKLYEKVFKDDKSNTKSLLPKALKSEKNKRAMKKAFKKFKKESHAK